MSRLTRRYRVLLAALLAVVGVAVGTVVSAPAAYASTPPPCGSLCDGKDPYFTYRDPYGNSYVCADSSSTPKFKVFELPNETIELRYSSKCQTTWARTGMVGVRIWVESYYDYDHTRLRSVASFTTTEDFRYTEMLDDAGLFNRACVQVPLGSAVCTDVF
jgi:hypothetical protein